MNTMTISPNTLTINNTAHAVYPGAILPHWITTAKAKGFDIAGRVVDRLHLALRCHACGVLQKVAYSGVIRPVIPKVSGHPFRFYPASDSGVSGHPVM